MADLVPANPQPSSAGLSPFQGNVSSPVAQVAAFVRQPAVARLVPLFMLASAIGIAALTWSVVVPAPQRILYSSLEDGERAEIAAALDTAGIDYRIDNATGAVTVAEDELYRARMTVASQGALAAPESGASMIDSLPMGASRTLEGDRLRAAQERELQLTIMEIDGVEAARVHLAKGDKSVFVRETSQPTASVMLRLVRGKALGNDQVTAIANLVAASVPGLTADQVRIVDQHGRLLSDLSGPESDGLELQARTEAKLRAQLAQLLLPIVGEGRFSTEVQVELDMDEQTSARESYDKDGVVRSETLIASGREATNALGRGVPGATSNLPPANPEAEQRAPDGTEGLGGADATAETSVDGASNATRTYEVGREVAVTSSGPGRLRRLSVAVAIDEAALESASEEDIARLEELVSSAVGADPERGDRVTVMTRKFQLAEIAEPAFWETPWFATIMRNVVALLSVILVLLLGVRPLQKAISRRLSSTSRNADDQDEDDMGVVAAIATRPSGSSPGSEVPGNLREQVELARRLAREQPDDALQALRRMLSEGNMAGQADAR